MREIACGIIIVLLLAGASASTLKTSAGGVTVSTLWQKDVSGYVKIANISGTGFHDVIVGAGTVFAFDGRGHSVWNFTPAEGVTTLEIGDINNDGLDGVLALAGTGWSRGPDGYVSADANLYAINSSGTLLWKHFLGNRYSGGGQQVISIGDINGDGKNEVAVDAFRHIMVFDYLGNEIWSYLLGSNIGNIRMSDVDGDGTKDVIATYWTDIYSGGVIALNGSGSVLWNYPTQAGMKALAVADVNGDGKNEIVASSDETLGTKQGIYLMNGSGSLIWYKQFANDTNSIAIGDIDGDRVNDIVAGTDGGDIFVINGVGSVLWSSTFSNTPISDVAIGDFDGDGRKNEVAACGAYYSLNSARQDGTWVFDSAGHMIWEFVGETNFVSLAVGDINADGIDEVVVSTVDLEHSSGGETCVLTSVFPASKVISATLEIRPDLLNLKSRGQWITGYVELPEGIGEINVSSILLNGTIPVDSGAAKTFNDNSNGTILMVKFDREEVSQFLLSEGVNRGNVTLSLTGNLVNGTSFVGNNTIRVRMPGDVNMDGRVDMKDVSLAARAFGSHIDSAGWNPAADENEDNKIDMRDVGLVARHFGGSYIYP